MKNKIISVIEIILILMCLCIQKIVNFTNIDLYLLLLLIIVLYAYTSSKKCDNNVRVFALIFSLLFSIGNLNVNTFGINHVIIVLIEIIGWYFLLKKVFITIKYFSDNYVVTSKEKNKEIKPYIFIGISMVIGFVLLLPYFIKCYPAVMTNDSFRQIWQVTGYVGYSNHHPWIHTLILKLFYNIGYGLTHKPNVGVATYIIFQMITACFTFSYVTYVLYRNNINKFLVGLIWLFFFLFPFNGIYAVTLWKDVIFSYIVLLFSVIIWDHYHNKKDWTIKSQIVFIILSFLICLLRSNGLIAYFMFIIIMILFYRKELFRLKYAFLAVLILVFGMKWIVMPIYKVQGADFIESLSIPAQQIAYVIKEDGDISKKEYKELSKVVDIDRIKEEGKDKQNLIISDPVKHNVRENDLDHYLDNNKGKFLKLWINIGLNNKEEYIKAYVKQTNGYWFHNYGKYWVYKTSLYTTFNKEDKPLDLYQPQKAPKIISEGIDKLLDLTSKVYYKTWSPAASLYAVLIGLFITINKKRNVLPYVLCISLVITLMIATPVSCEFRYAYPLFITFPALLIVPLTQETNSTKKNKKSKSSVK